MKHLFITICLFFTCSVSANSQNCYPTKTESISKIAMLSSENLSQAPKKSKYKIERRGCCSHHGGVCGCSSGRASCCDGTLSPSCGC